MTPKHRPPSRVKYDEAHPVIAVHLDRETYDAALKLRETTGKSFGQLVRESLGLVVGEYATIQTRADSEGFQRGLEQGRAEGRPEGYVEGRLSCGIVDRECSHCHGHLVAQLHANSKPIEDGAAQGSSWVHDECLLRWFSSHWKYELIELPPGHVDSP